MGRLQRVARENPDLVAVVLAEVVARGPLTSRRLEKALEHDLPRDRSDWGWNWSLVKSALEHLFWSGQISSAGRTSQFERRYAALERVLPKDVAVQSIPPGLRPRDDDAFRRLMLIAARAHGVRTEQDLRDYFRLRPEQARPALESSSPPVTSPGSASTDGGGRHTCTRTSASRGRCMPRLC